MKSQDKKHGKKKTYLSDKELKEVKEVKMVASGFWGVKAVEDFVKKRIGFLAEGCKFTYIPFPDDIRTGKTLFNRYDLMCHHKDGELILHYKVNFDTQGKFVPDPIADNTIILQGMKE